MASSSKTEWLMIIPDKPGMKAKRLEVRPAHVAALEETIKSGNIKFGGAILHEVPTNPDDASSLAFAGSTVIYMAHSKEECLEFLNKDIYVEAGVWDMDKVQIYPLKTALRVP